MTLDKFKIPGHFLHIEVTESVFNSDFHKINEKMFALKAAGVKFSVDDFGTGFSSLSVIHNSSFDFIKIDRTFIKDIQGKGKVIIQAVIDISNSLDISIIAEGVETKDQMDLLVEYGVPYMQGFYFSKPLEMNQVIDDLDRRSQHPG